MIPKKVADFFGSDLRQNKVTERCNQSKRQCLPDRSRAGNRAKSGRLDKAVAAGPLPIDHAAKRK
jgi:hypothetical protein